MSRTDNPLSPFALPCFPGLLSASFVVIVISRRISTIFVSVVLLLFFVIRSVFIVLQHELIILIMFTYTAALNTSWVILVRPMPTGARRTCNRLARPTNPFCTYITYFETHVNQSKILEGNRKVRILHGVLSQTNSYIP